MGTIILTSQNLLKVNVVKDVLKFFPHLLEYNIVSYSTSNAQIPPQPINTGIECAKMRIQYVLENYKCEKYDFIISIENSININNIEKDNLIEDVCNIVIQNNNGEQYIEISDPILIDSKYYYQSLENTSKDYKLKEFGLEYTIGSMISKEYNDIISSNWSIDKRFGGLSREIQISDTLQKCLTKMMKN